MNTEQKLVLELCRIEGYNKENVELALNKRLDYAYVLGQLHMHRMAAAAYYVLQKTELLGKVNREFRSSLKAVYQYNQYKVASYKKALDELVYLLENVDFPYTILKGGFLAYLYPPGVRTSNDIDLLVLRKDLPRIIELFRNHGFVQGFIRNERIVEAKRQEIVNAQLNRGEIIPFVKEVRWQGLEFLEVDINISLDEKSSEDTSVIAQMLERRSGFATDRGERLYTLDREDFLIHLCTHLYKEAAVYQWVEMGRDLSIYKFLDIWLYYRKFIKQQEGEQALADRIQACGKELECYYAFYYTGEIFDKELFLPLLENIGNRQEYIDSLDRVYDPVCKRYYRYKMEFLQRLFDSRRERDLEGENE